MPGFGKDGKGVILYETFEINPTGLAAKDVLLETGNYGGNMEEDFRIIKTEGWVSFVSGTTGDCVIFGICDGALTAALIEECIEASPVDKNSFESLEKSHRPVFPLAMLIDATGGGHIMTEINKTLKWTFSQPEGWKYWVYNADEASALDGSSVIIRVFLKHYGVWVT